MVWLNTKGRIPVALTIAGSDSGGGAGIEADLKTFAALGVHGTVALTAITAQNTTSVTGVQAITPELIEKQIEAVVEDLGVDAAKTGMLYESKIIEVVAKAVSKYGFPLVVDPVMIAKSGAPLLKEEARETLINTLLPLAKVVTPNIPEAEVISGIKIRSIDDMKKAAKLISKTGVEAVVVKGGHMEDKYSVDILYYKGNYYTFSEPRILTKNTHGTGCSFSAAIAACLAKNMDILESVKEAKKLIQAAIRYSINIGAGHGPVNPMALLYLESEKWRAYSMVLEAKRMLESSENVFKIVPEVGMNIVMALPGAESVGEVVGIPGRLVKVGSRIKAVADPAFGGSDHLARYVISALKHDQSKRAAINVRYDKGIIELLERKGLSVSFYDRRLEPEDVKRREGATIPWGVGEAIRRIGRVPDVIYHEGDWGKEPMIVILGENPVDIANLIIEISKSIGD